MNKTTSTFLLILILLSSVGPKISAQVNIDSTSFDLACHDLFTTGTVAVIGEVHSVIRTSETEYFIIRKLAEKGYNKIFIEGGTSEAFILNEFLSTGDTAILKYTRAREPGGTYKKFIFSLAALNKQKNIGFRFYGLDFERAPCVNYLFSKWFNGVATKSNEVNEQIRLLLSIHNEAKNSEEGLDRLNEVCLKIQKNFEFDQSYYREILGDKFSQFKDIIYNPVTRYGRDRDLRMAAQYTRDSSNFNNSIVIIGDHHLLADNKNKFINLLTDRLSGIHPLVCFPMIYKSCLAANDGSKYSSDKRELIYLRTALLEKPVVDFYLLNPSIIPAGNTKTFSVITGIYNQ